MRCSVSGIPVARQPAMIPATATAAVPWMSSLKQVMRFRYRSSSRKALTFLKSSHCRSAFGKRYFTACTNSSTSESYSAPRSRGWGQPRYSSSSSSALLSVPTSRLMGSVCEGWMPAAPQ